MPRPPNFSWLVPKKLAVCGFPRTKEHLEWLNNEGVGTIISLTMKKPPVEEYKDLSWHNIRIIPIPDFTAPSIEQIEDFLTITQDSIAHGKPVAVHCFHGKGRAGTMAACYLIQQRRISGDEAISEVRRLRPGSVETSDQEARIREFGEYIKSELPT